MKYPIGQQDFPSIREEGKVYVDKTRIIYELVNNSKYVFLARPRRFGKSLLLSTIKAFFEGRKDLFHGLAVEALEKDWVRHPVFLIELSRVNPRSHDSLKELLNQQFSIWEEELGIVNSNNDFGSRFATILIKSYDKHRQKAVVLVDEYDNPLINTLGDDRSLIHDQNRELLKSVYSNLKALDSHIRFGMLTGVSRFSKMSIFSGLNNLDDISFDNRYSQICGITEKEITSALKQGVVSFADSLYISEEEALLELKKNYDGYHFSKESADIYNPFSLLSALDKKEIGNYWFSTATPSFLMERLYEEGMNLNHLLNSEASSATLASSDTSHRSPVALLFQTGYLTIKGYDKEWDQYKLRIPNLEVRKGFFEEMANVFQDKDHSDLLSVIKLTVNSLRDGQPEKFLNSLKSYLASIPANVTQKSSELYFENNIYIILSLIGIYCKTETVIAKGRIDIEIQTDRFIYIMELKLDRSPEEAMKQIDEKEYTLPYLNSKKQIFKIGINFSSATRNLSSWLIK